MKKVLLKILLIVIILEVSIFNFNSYRVLSNKDKKEFSKKDITYLQTEEGVTFVKISNVNSEIKTLHIELNNADVVNYEFLYTDETSSMLTGTPVKTYVETLENSKYMPCYLSGISNEFGIKIYNDNDNNIEINSITINEKIPFKFNFTRIILLYLIILSVILIRNHEIFNKPFSNKDFKQELILIIIVAVFSSIACYINDFSKEENKYDFYSLQFVDAIVNGKVSLEEEPSEELLELENPYDFSARDNVGLIKGIDYIWDAALYNGKYYVYFGILPALLVMVPYHLITNEYMICATVVLIFSILTAISLKDLVKNIFKRYFQDVPFKFMVYSLLIVLFGSQILILNGIPRFYEVPIISGLFFTVTGINFIMIANKKKEINYKYMFLACLFLSIAVACRPTQLIASLIVLPLIIKIFINNIKLKKNINKSVLAICVPYAVVGGLLMYYNYIRFGSIFEFGASYQLTINDMSNLRNRFMVIGMGIVCNLFSIPNFIPVFPYIYNHNNLVTFYGHYYIENMVGGLFILVPICFSLFGIYKIFKYHKNDESIKFILMFTIVRNDNMCNKYYDGRKHAKIYG